MTTEVETRTECGTCRANQGELRAPGGIIYEDGFWRLEHLLEPVPFAGWLVLKPLRHIESLAEMNSEEVTTFGPLVQSISRALHDELEPAKVYLCSFGEGEGFAHIHFHFIPRFAETPDELRGPRIFDYLRNARDIDPDAAVTRRAEEIAASIRDRLKRMAIS